MSSSVNHPSIAAVRAPLPVEWVYWAVSRVDDLDAIEDEGGALDAAVARFAAEGLCDLEAWRGYWNGDEP